jgi:probable HAF family extracellular repeat protein
MRDLGTLGGIVAGGNAVNDAGTATGYSSLPGNDVFHAFRWSNGNMLDLGTLPGFHDSFGAALNERGDVVGSAANGSAVRAFAFEGSSLLNLGTLPGLPNSTASGINDLGQIVGWSYDSSTQRPFLIADGAMRDLNSLVPAGTRATLVYAHAIDDLGDIAGTAAQNGELRGFLLQPSPGAQLANVVQLIDGWNATRAPVNRSGTGFFAKRAVLLFDGGSIPAGCRALTDLRTDAAQEQKRNYLAPSQISELTTLTDAVGESAGCP